jgi:hypothetical protein
MANSILKYALSDGFIHNWLVAGPLVIPVEKINPTTSQPLEEDILKQYYEVESGVTEIPVDLGSLGSITQKYPEITWRYYCCREDHLVDFSAFHSTCEYERAWAYAQLVVPSNQEVTFVLTTNGPADVWLDGQHIYRQEHFSKSIQSSSPLSATLQNGSNDLLVRFEMGALRESSYKLALQILGLATNNIEVDLPTSMEEENVVPRENLEKLAVNAYLDRYVYGYLYGDRYNKNEPVSVYFSDNIETKGEISCRIQSLDGDIFQEVTKVFEAGEMYEMAKNYPLRNGAHHLAWVPPVFVYYKKKICFDRKDLFFIIRTPYSQKVAPLLSARKKEALEDAAERRNDSLYCEIARMAIGHWENVEWKNIRKAIARVNQRSEGSICDLLGLLGLMLRYKKMKSHLGEMRLEIEACISGYRYWADEPGGDVMDFEAENRQLLFFACEFLAGQLLPEFVFMNNGKPGAWHKEHAETLLVTWLKQRGRFGFKEWDSPVSMAETLAALSHLVDLADSTLIVELSSILMDKIMFSMAVNSYQGAYGSTRGSCDTASVISSRLEATSGISRLMWGMGNFNEAVMGTVSLACCRKYNLPELIQKIANDQPAALWNREQQCQPFSNGSTSEPGRWQVNKVSYRTSDYLLSSAQDYQPGKPGSNEHIWQATLGPDAVVFVNHPVSMSDSDANRPNLWVGNGVLPRVAQWGDVLIAIHNLPKDDWLGFTHAYFPAKVFDEYNFQGHWAFARYGKGYLALRASQGFKFITQGPTAFRELRSFGKENIWVCHMGQELLDGSFVDFQKKILAMRVYCKDLSVKFKSLRNDRLAFSWQQSFGVNGVEQSLSGFRHFENPYCIADLPADQMDIVYQDKGIRLKFE